MSNRQTLPSFGSISSDASYYKPRNSFSGVSRSSSRNESEGSLTEQFHHSQSINKAFKNERRLSSNSHDFPSKFQTNGVLTSSSSAVPLSNNNNNNNNTTAPISIITSLSSAHPSHGASNPHNNTIDFSKVLQTPFYSTKLIHKTEHSADNVLREACKKTFSSIPNTGFKLKRTLKGHFDKVYDFSWSLVHPYLVSASQDGKLIIWNAKTGYKVGMINLTCTWVMTCDYSPSSNLIASGGLDNACTIHEIKYKDGISSKPINKLLAHKGCISTTKFLSDERLLTGSGDGLCILWDVEASKPILKFETHLNGTHPKHMYSLNSPFSQHSSSSFGSAGSTHGGGGHCDVLSLAVERSKGLFISGSSDSLIKLWDIRVRTPIKFFSGHSADVNSLKFFPNGNTFASGSDDSTCKLFDLRYERELNNFMIESLNSGVTSVDFSSSGRLLFAGYDDSVCIVWDTLKAEKVTLLKGHRNRISSLSTSPDGYCFCTSSWDGNLKIWTRFF